MLAQYYNFRDADLRKASRAALGPRPRMERWQQPTDRFSVRTLQRLLVSLPGAQNIEWTSSKVDGRWSQWSISLRAAALLSIHHSPMSIHQSLMNLRIPSSGSLLDRGGEGIPFWHCWPVPFEQR